MLGTVLVLEENRFQQELWTEHLGFVSVYRPKKGNGHVDAARTDTFKIAEAARNMDVLLDLTGMFACSNAASLLDERFSTILTPDEASFKRMLLDLVRQVPPSIRHGHPAWAEIQSALRRLGLPRTGRTP